MKKSTVALLSVLLASSLSAFDFPFEEVKQESFNSNFGQFRGDTTSTSLVFTNEGSVRALNEGKIIMYITEDNDDPLFNSTLGSVIFVDHDDGIMSVYGNLDSQSLEKNARSLYGFDKNQVIAETGNGGWQEKKSTLELQILDISQGIAINPRTLLPRVDKEKKIVNNEVTLMNKDGRTYSFATVRTFQAGTYKVYEKYDSRNVTYKTRTGINGDVQETVSYDIIGSENGQIYLYSNKNKYPGTVVFPDSSLHLIGEVILKPGKSILMVEQENIQGDVSTTNYNITVY